MPYLARPDAELYYEDTGKGPPLVFAHGLGGNHLSWWQQVPHFAGGNRCVTFAHRGFFPSRSTLPAGDLSSHFVDDLEALLDALRLDRVTLVAQSMGGWTCLGFALRHPDRVRALVMADTAGAFAHGIPSPPRQEELFARGIHPAAGERMAREQPALHYLYWGINNLAGDLDKQAIARSLFAAQTVTAEELSVLTMPVLGIAGLEDRSIDPEAVRRLCAAVPDARFAPVPEAGHSVYFERPAEFNRLVEEFLAAAT
jgi:3-oxoadipate enol-lactonase